MTESSNSALAPAVYWRPLLRLLLLVALLVTLHYAGQWALHTFESTLMPMYDAFGNRSVHTLPFYLVIAVYVIAMALPYVPGIEISLAVMVLFGAPGAAVVYGSTWLALCLSFAVGRLVPARAIAGFFTFLHMQRGEAWVRRLEPLSPDERLHLLMEAAPVRIVPFLLRHRYLALAAVFNLPGNSLLGGGGGIALAAGASRLFRPPAYLLTLALAIAPVPAFVITRAWWIG